MYAATPFWGFCWGGTPWFSGRCLYYIDWENWPVNPFPANISILYPLKTPENLWFSGVFREYKMGTLAGNGLNPLQRENYWRIIHETMAQWGLNVEDCVWNSVLLYFYHWICTDCNKDLIYGNDFDNEYYCSYFHHYHYHCLFDDSVAFIVAVSAIVLVFFSSLLLKLVWLSLPLLSFL